MMKCRFLPIIIPMVEAIPDVKGLESLTRMRKKSFQGKVI